MAVTFRLNDAQDSSTIAGATAPLGLFKRFLHEACVRETKTSQQIVWHVYGDCDEENSYFCIGINTSAFPLAVIAKCLGNSEQLIVLIDQAQFMRRRLEIHGNTSGDTVMLSLSSNSENMPELEVAYGNAYALFDALDYLHQGDETVGCMTIRDLRERISSPGTLQRISEMQLTRYLQPLIAFAAFDGDPDRSRVEWA